MSNQRQKKRKSVFYLYLKCQHVQEYYFLALVFSAAFVKKKSNSKKALYCPSIAVPVPVRFKRILYSHLVMLQCWLQENGNEAPGGKVSKSSRLNINLNG